MSNNSSTGEVISVTQKNEKNPHVVYSRTKRKILKHTWLVRIFVVILIFFGLGTIFLTAAKLYKDLGVGKFVNIANNFIFPETQVLESDNDRTSILLMGIGGKGHEGSTLTDTMQLVSVSLKDKNIQIISIPRDLWLPDIRAKINSAYYWGNQKSESGGIALSKASVKDVLGIKPNYAVVIDFSGFKKIIDVLGGINVNVENGFTDNLYPIAGKENDLCNGDKLLRCRYEEITFKPGMQFMDGETALKFVRSRHSDGDQGTDTARQSRQQKVIEAIKNKVLTTDVYLNPKKIGDLLKATNDSVESDIDPNILPVLARKVFDAKDNVNTKLIPETLLVNPPISATYDKQYVFIPKAGNGNWKEINAWVNSLF